jgi:hypothetical protein
MPTLYQELADEYQLDRTEDGVTGRRVWIRDDLNGATSPAGLPLVGTSLMVDDAAFTVPNCICRSLQTAYRGGIAHIIATYRTRPSTVEWTGASISRDPDTRIFEGTADVALLNDPSSTALVWSGTTDAPATSIGKPLFAGTFTIPRSDLSTAQKNALFVKIVTHAGTINNASFQSLRTGSVRFDGIRGGTYRDDNGNLRWSFDLIFSYRLLNDPYTSITSNDWLYDFDPQTGAWKQAVTSTGAKAKYTATDLSLLLT